MPLQTLADRLAPVIEQNMTSGYRNLTNFPVFEACLSEPSSQLSRLVSKVIEVRPKIDDFNLVCLVAGALNYFAAKYDSQAPGRWLRSCNEMNLLVRKYRQEMLNICQTRNNSPTIPQRAMPFACNSPPSAYRTGVLDIGCSRGDCGLVWLTIDKFLKESCRWFFPDWGESIPSGQRENCRPIAKYLGVDRKLIEDDNRQRMEDKWLLALWGFDDPRRESLRDYYTTFRPSIESSSFQRIQASVLEITQKKLEIMDWFDDCEQLIVITSYMMYQLTATERRQAALHINDVMESFTRRRKAEGKACEKPIWLNQGLSRDEFLDGNIQISNIELLDLSVRKNRLWAKRVAKIFDDTASGWELIGEDAVELGSILS